MPIKNVGKLTPMSDTISRNCENTPLRRSAV